eukprot:6192653-Pleurochrysis_carterae.AAC.3
MLLENGAERYLQLFWEARQVTRRRKNSEAAAWQESKTNWQEKSEQHGAESQQSGSRMAGEES